MDTMACRFMKVDMKEDHKLEVEEEEDIIDHKKSFQDIKHGMKITCMKIMEKILMLVKLTMVATMSWPKKEDIPKVALKDHSKPKVEEKGRLITNRTRCFKCNSVGHIAITYTTKKIEEPTTNRALCSPKWSFEAGPQLLLKDQHQRAPMRSS
ncbi:hypothetical protein M9H77_22690 [Catharanthus roseus]|uniref:Uncharacterized protein n=1 Tax=Catharanthus roseus TaxID=4058 RepID=A0ACC0ASE0_CATRO|nr:hypothetical protein M9H77_22690 [Catharanthus roseus]